MPANIVKPGEEAHWARAKKIVEAHGGEKDKYALTTHVFKKIRDAHQAGTPLDDTAVKAIVTEPMSKSDEAAAALASRGSTQAAPGAPSGGLGPTQPVVPPAAAARLGSSAPPSPTQIHKADLRAPESTGITIQSPGPSPSTGGRAPAPPTPPASQMAKGGIHEFVLAHVAAQRRSTAVSRGSVRVSRAALDAMPFLKAHVKRHSRVVGGKPVQVKEHEREHASKRAADASRHYADHPWHMIPAKHLDVGDHGELARLADEAAQAHERAAEMHGSGQRATDHSTESATKRRQAANHRRWQVQLS